MIKTILILGFTILFFAILGDEIAPYLISIGGGVAIIGYGIGTFSFIVNDVWDYYPQTFKVLTYFWISYRILQRIMLGK